jgi:hypothetical protein
MEGPEISRARKKVPNRGEKAIRVFLWRKRILLEILNGFPGILNNASLWIHKLALFIGGISVA